MKEYLIVTLILDREFHGKVKIDHKNYGDVMHDITHSVLHPCDYNAFSSTQISRVLHSYYPNEVVVCSFICGADMQEQCTQWVRSHLGTMEICPVIRSEFMKVFVSTTPELKGSGACNLEI